MKLLTELTFDTQIQVIEEESTKKKSLYIESENAIQANIKNKNNRIYPIDFVTKDLKRYITEHMKQGRAWGELNHPNSAQINLDRVSHRFVDIKSLDGDKNYFYTKAKVLDSPTGKILESLIGDKEGRVGQSTRAVGTVKNTNDGQVVQEDLYFVTAGDIVADPSAQKAFVSGIYEGVEYEWDNGVLVETVTKHIDENYKTNLSNEEKLKVLIEGFEKILQAISNGGKS